MRATPVPHTLAVMLVIAHLQKVVFVCLAHIPLPKRTVTFGLACVFGEQIVKRIIAMSAESSFTSNYDIVTDEDVRMFRTTLLARRFPGLKDMSDEDVKQLIIADRKATGRRLEKVSKTYPKSSFSPPTAKRSLPPNNPPVWVPVNPEAAKHDVTRPFNESYVCLGLPYDSDRTEFLQDKHSDDSKRLGRFMPTCSSQARDSIKVDYYLLSPDKQTKDLERQRLSFQAHDHVMQLHQSSKSQHSKSVVP